MNWMNKLEQKLGRYAIPNISKYLTGTVLIGLLLSLMEQRNDGIAVFMSLISFDAQSILHGQIWRLISWIFVPLGSFDFFGLLLLYCIWSWSTSLESYLGAFRMNVYMVEGILLSDLGGLVVYLVSKLVWGEGIPMFLTPYYILFSMLMMIALLMPEGEVRLWFVLPIKMKWMLVAEGVYMAYLLYRYFKIGYQISLGDVSGGLIVMLEFGGQIIFAVLNMVLFFWLCKPRFTRGQKKRRKQFQAQFSQPRPGSGITKHKCAICGRTELDDPDLTFRYCSKCAGNYEYCNDHLFTHEHRKPM